MNKAIKRICNIDIKRYNSEKTILNNSGIFAYFDEEDIMNCKAMIIGPEDTPYSHGILFFDIQFPHNYPFTPPKVNYISNSMTRIHPNLYVNGKVCLSILGTWHGPGWTPAMNIISLLTTIQSLLTKNPIEHEPHFEKETGALSKRYIKIINYERFKSLIINRYKDIRPDLNYFKNDIIRHIHNNKCKILEIFNNVSSGASNKEVLYSQVYAIKLIINWSKLKDRLFDIFESIDSQCKEDPSILYPKNVEKEENIDKVAEQDEILNTSVTQTIQSKPKKYIRKCPNDPAKLYEVSTIKLSENDNKNYIVKEYIKNDKSIKKWIKA